MSPATITEAVDAMLIEYGRYRGQQVVKVIETVVEQQEYQAPSPLVTVDDLVWGDDVDVRGDIFLRAEAFAPFDLLAGHDFFRNPSLANIVYQQVEDFRKQFEGGWEVFYPPSGGGIPSVRISPPPWTVQKMAFIGRAPLVWGDIPDKDLEILMAGALWKLNETRYEGTSGVSSTSYSGGSVTFDTASFKELAEKHRDKFLDSLGAGLPIIRWG